MEPDEGAWNRALRAWFFRPDLAGRGAYLAVDEEALAAIATEWNFQVADPTESLSRAIQHRVSERTPLRSWLQEASRWKASGSEGTPPFLSILAVTVLAATIVDQVNDRSYYRRLNSLLHLHSTGMPRDFYSDIQQLWTCLNEWLADRWHGRLGVPTATNIGGQANVGWAQSQILLRTTDRIKLPLFFTDLGLQPEQVVDGDLLVRRLRSWSADGRIPSRRLGLVLQDRHLSELLADALHSELVHWDGTLRDEAGRVALKLMLAFHERSARLQLASHVPEQLSGTAWRVKTADGSEYELQMTGSDEPQLLELPVSLLAMSDIIDGAPLHARPVSISDRQSSGAAAGTTHPALALVMPRRDVLLLCPDDRLARWLQVPNALLGRPHLVLVRSGAAAEAARIMSRLSSEDVRSFRRIHKPAGWEAFKFTPDCYEAFNGPLAALSPRGNQLSAVDGGLPISKRRRTYLTSGSPDIIWDLVDQAVPVVVDNAEIGAHGRDRLRLADLRLAPGSHAVNVGGVRYHLTLVDEFADKPFDGVVSFTFKAGRDSTGTACMTALGATTSAGRNDPDDVTIKGAAISISPSARQFSVFPVPPHTRIGGRHYVLGRPGEVAVVDVQPPKWLQELRLTPHLADAVPSLAAVRFRPMWILRVTRGGVTVCAVHTEIGHGSQPDNQVVSPELWHRVAPHLQAAAAEPADRARWGEWIQDAVSFDPDEATP
jgi:hypothetical protein